MRVLLLILMIAIGIGGYSAAAHAFSKDLPHAAVSLDTKDETKKSDNHSGPSAQCDDCTHCCFSYPHISLSVYSFALPEHKVAFFATLADLYKNLYPPSLLRPPIALI